MILYFYLVGVISSFVYNLHHVIEDGLFFLSDLPDHLLSIFYPIVNLRPITVFTLSMLLSIIILLVDYVKTTTNNQRKD